MRKSEYEVLIVLARKNDVSVTAVGTETSDKLWLANDKTQKIMRSAGIAVDRFLSMYPDWHRVKNVGDVLRQWGRR